MKAMNCMLDVMTSGVNSSLLFLLFDDKKGSHSDNIFDALAIINGAKIPHIVTNSNNIIHSISEATNLSDKRGLPYCIVIDADEINTEVLPFNITKPEHAASKYERNIYKYLVTPLLAGYQYENLEARLNNQKSEIPKPELPVLPDELPYEWQEIIFPYIPFFDVFKKFRGDIVVGDTSLPSLFALEPYACIDITLHMGGSIPTAIGAYLAGNKSVWALTGDFAFISCGNLGLIEAKNRKIPLKVIIFDNGISGATGGQLIHIGLTEQLLLPYNNNVTRIILNNTKSTQLEHILAEMSDSQELRILHIII